MKYSKTPRLPNGQVPAGLPEKLDGSETDKPKTPQTNNRRGRSRTNLKPEDGPFETFKGP